MTCDRSPQEIQLWLDGDLDLSSHAAECPSCQNQVSLMAGLRRQLAPPPSPLGRDFARRTAHRVLERSRVTPTPPRRGWKLLWSNPLLAILQRQSQLRLNRLPSLALLCLLFSPGLLLAQGSGDSRSAYILVLQLGLGLGIPLLALARDLTTLSGLIKGRCLEEMVQAGTPAPLLVDTLLVHGLRHLGAALSLSALFLSYYDGGEFLSKLPALLLGYVVLGYVGSSQLLARSSGLSFLGTVLIGLAWNTPWVYLGGVLTALLARRSATAALIALSQGRSQRAVYSRAPGWQKLAARWMPDWALLQRELARQPLFGPGLLAIQILLVYQAHLSPGAQPLCLGLMSLVLACQVTLREMQQGTLEILAQSGLKLRHWWQSLGLLSGLRLAPAVLAFTYSLSRQSGLIEAFCLGLLLLVSVACGALVGTVVTMRSQSSTQAWQAVLRETFWILALSWVSCSFWLVALNIHNWLRSGLIPEWLVAAVPSVFAWTWRAHLYRHSRVIWWPNRQVVGIAAVIPFSLFFEGALSGQATVLSTFLSAASLAAFWSAAWAWAHTPAPQRPLKSVFSNAFWVFVPSYLTGLLMLTTGWLQPWRVEPAYMGASCLRGLLWLVLLGAALNGRKRAEVSEMAQEVAKRRRMRLSWVGLGLLTVSLVQLGRFLYLPLTQPGYLQKFETQQRLSEQLKPSEPIKDYYDGILAAWSRPDGYTYRISPGLGMTPEPSAVQAWISSQRQLPRIHSQQWSRKLVHLHSSLLWSQCKQKQSESFLTTLESLQFYAESSSLAARYDAVDAIRMHLSQALAQGLFQSVEQIDRAETIWNSLAQRTDNSISVESWDLRQLHSVGSLQGLFPAVVLRAWSDQSLRVYSHEPSAFWFQGGRTVSPSYLEERYREEKVLLSGELMTSLCALARSRVRNGRYPSNHWQASHISYERLPEGYRLAYRRAQVWVEVVAGEVVWRKVSWLRSPR